MANIWGIVGVDWLTLVFPADVAGDVRDLCNIWGGKDVTSTGGQKFYKHRELWPLGLSLLSDHASGHDSVCVEIPGGFLKTRHADDRIEMLRLMAAFGGVPTRLDVAVDVFGTGVDLVSRVESACAGGELVRAVVWQPVHRFKCQERTGYSVTIGKRGSQGSGRQVCVYDKGLEQNKEGSQVRYAEGEWVRWEARFYGQVAERAAAHILRSDDWKRVASGLAAFAIDFRVANGQTALSRRPRAQWWCDVLGDLTGMVFRADREASSWPSFVAHFRRSVGGTLRKCEEQTGISAASIAQMLLFDCQASKQASPACLEFSRDVAPAARLAARSRSHRPSRQRVSA